MLSLVNAPSVNAQGNERPTPGIVQLVGTGPGNPDLLTLRALQVMQRADVAIHDRRIGSQILDLLRRDAERVEVDGLAPRRRSTSFWPGSPRRASASCG